MRSIAVMVIIETDDPRLDPDKIDVSTVQATAALRKAVVDNLPRLNRVVFVTSEAEARIMCEVREAVVREMKAEPAQFSPPHYIPPTRE